MTAARMVHAGYIAKVVEPTPAGLQLPAGIAEICSVSDCISATADGAVAAWAHNQLRWYNSPDLAWSVVPEADRSRYRLFAYRLHERFFHKGEACPLVLPDDVHAVPVPASFVTIGYDAVSKLMESVLGFECSPLSCNSMAAELPANRSCLFDTLEEALQAASRFSVEEPEPGDYYVVEVLEGESC